MFLACAESPPPPLRPRADDPKDDDDMLEAVELRRGVLLGIIIIDGRWCDVDTNPRLIVSAMMVLETA